MMFDRAAFVLVSCN